MSLASCLDCGPETLPALVAIALIFAAPLGAFVLRRQIQRAHGAWRFAGSALQTFAVLSAPFAVLILLWGIAD